MFMNIMLEEQQYNNYFRSGNNKIEMETDVNSCTVTGMTKKIVAHPKTRVMVMDAVADLNGNGGVSLKAIKKYIAEVHEVDVEKKGHSIRKAITKALANGELVQMKGSGPNETFKLPLVAKDVIKPSHSKPILTAEMKNDRTEKEGMEFQYESGFCDSSFSSVDLRTEHKKEVHSEVHEFPCKYCGQLFLSEINLYTHLVIHSESAEEKPFKCHVCNGGFSRKKQLKKHFQFIHGEKANDNEEDEPISELRSMIIGALEFLTYTRTNHGASYELINRNVQEAFNAKTDCLNVLNEMVRDGIVSLSDDGTYSKNTLHLYWSNQNIQVDPGDSGKVRKGNSERITKRRRSVTETDGTESKRQRMDVNVTTDEDSPRHHLSNEEIIFARSVVGGKGTPGFNQFSRFLITGEGKKCLEVLRREGVNLTSMSSILHQAGANACKAFKDLYDLWFDERGKKTEYLKTLENEGIKLSNMSSILSGARANATKAFKELYDLWFDEHGQKTHYLISLEKEEISLSNTASILSLAGSNAAITFKDLYDLWFDEQGRKTKYLDTLKDHGVSLARMSSILNGAGDKAPKAFKDLYDLWFNRKGKKTRYLKTLIREGINLSSVSSILGKARSNAATAFKKLYDLWFDEEGKKTRYLDTLKDNGVSLARMSGILSRAGAKAPHAFKELYDLLFDEQGNKTRQLRILEEEGIHLTNVSNILHGAGANAAKGFKDLCDLWFNRKGKKTQYLKTLKREGIDLSTVSGILSKAGANAAKTFKNLHDLWFDEQGNKKQHLKTLERQGINLSSMSGIVGGAGSNAPKALKELYDLWFDKQGNKTLYLRILENEGINLSNISNILHRSGVKAVKAFKDLCNLWFDEDGNVKQHLKHFIEEAELKKRFTLRKLTSILNGAGAKSNEAFINLHNVCFNDEGKRTRLLDNFYDAGLNPRDLSSILCGTGMRASFILEKLHSVCFDVEGGKSKLLDDFCNAGFRLGGLCSVLSGTAESLEKFYDFCFIGKGKRYLRHFSKEGFTPQILSEILHGAGANICSALKDFHDICFDRKGNRMKALDDFCQSRFRPSDLSSILSMAGSNANFILRSFHRLCFNEENYLNHFLAEKKLFRPKRLSKVLHRVGLSICSAFEKFHGLCFDEEGRKTEYLNDLIKNNSRNAVIDTLYKKVKKLKKHS